MFTKYQVNVLSKALKQTEAEPRSSGTPFLLLELEFLKHKLFLVEIQV